MGMNGFNAISPSFRIDMLYATLLSNNAFLERFLAIPPSSFFGTSVTTFGELVNALSVLFKLSLLEEPGWDLQRVRTTSNTSAIIARLAHRFEEASLAVDSRIDIDGSTFYTRCARKLARVRGWYDAKVAAEPNQSEQQLPLATADLTSMGGMQFEDIFDEFNGVDLQDLFGDWESMMS